MGKIHYICSMDYKRIYDSLMESRLLLKEERIKLRKQGEYFEAHHIIPKCMGGEGKQREYEHHPNLVMLTPREHYISHALLWLIHRNQKMAYSFYAMSNIKRNGRGTYIPSSRMYEEVRCYLNSAGRSPETKEKIRKAHLGKKLSPEQRERLRQLSLGRKQSPEQIAKMVETKKRNLLLGVTKRLVMSPEAKEKLRQARLGKKMSPETIAKVQETKKRNRLLGLIPKHTMSPEGKEKIRQANSRRIHSPESKIKRVETRRRNISLGLTKKQVLSPESIAKAAETRKKNLLLGITKKYVPSQETKEKLRQAHLGKKLSPEAKEKLRQARLGKKLSPESIAKREETKKRNRLLKLAQQQETQNN